MSIEFITSINDYKLSRKQRVFAFALADKLWDRACYEKVRHTAPMSRPLDSPIMWRLGLSMANAPKALCKSP